MKVKLLIVAFFLLTAQSVISQNQEQPDTSEPTTIGFSSHSVLDNSRPSVTHGNYGRKIQINIWYPGDPKNSFSKMAFSDYLKIRHEEMNNNDPTMDLNKTIEGYYEWPLSQGANQSLIDSISSAKIPMKAEKSIDLDPGKYSIILLIHGSAVDFAFLAESLVEQGFVVINVPYKGYLKKELDVNGIGMETEIRDFEFALSSLSSNNHLDLTNITALGFSFGGQSAVGLACRNPNVKVVISYDGGIGTRFGARLLNESPFCGTENLSASLLHIYDASYSQTYLDKIRSFVHSDRTAIGLDKIAHWHFTSFGYLASQIPGLFGTKDYSIEGYSTILEVTKSYLQAQLKNGNAIDSTLKDEYELISKFEQYQAIKN